MLILNFEYCIDELIRTAQTLDLLCPPVLISPSYTRAERLRSSLPVVHMPAWLTKSRKWAEKDDRRTPLFKYSSKKASIETVKSESPQII